ncbi:MAG: ATP-binding protein, partial [Myxococcota bacterium]
MSRTLTIKLQGLRRMLDKRPHDGRVWLQIAETLLELERDEEARDAAQNAFRHADDDEARSSAEALLLGLGDEPPAPVLATATPAPGDDSKDEPAPSNLRVLRGGKAGTPDDAPDATATLETIGFEDVGGLDEVKDQIRMKIVLPFQKPDVFRAFGKKRGGGILLYGPPGCGKTLLARATAGECRATFMNVAINEVLDMWFGQSEQKLAALFEEARRRAPTV